MFDSHERCTPAYQKMNAAEYSMDDLLWFLRVAQVGSLSGAATQLGVPKSTLSRRLERIETAVGVALVHRNSRSFRLTDVGARLVETATPLVQQLEQATSDLLLDQTPAKGLVRFTASGSFGKLVLVPIISSYLLENPEVRIDAELTDRKVNLIKDGFDFAVRIGELPDSGLRARRIARVSRMLCASPAYIRTHGSPETPEDLARHSCLIQSKTSANISLQGASRTVNVVLPARLIVGPSDNLLVPVQMGLGISALPEIQIAGQLRRGELVRVLPSWDMPEFDAQILYPAQKRLPPATRGLMEYFAARIPTSIAQLLAAS
jgi:DNA-binding transcriptional LysR family regulator